MSGNWMEFIGEQIVFNSIIVGLSAWLGKVWATRISARENQKNAEEIEKLKNELNIRQNVFRIQFEKEFAIYQRLCEINAKIRNCLAHLIHRKSRTIEEEQVVRDETLKSLNAFIELVNSQEAFMNEEVYHQCLIILQMICSLDNDKIKHDELFYSKLDIETKQLFKVIRSRFNNLNALN